MAWRHSRGWLLATCLVAAPGWVATGRAETWRAEPAGQPQAAASSASEPELPPSSAAPGARRPTPNYDGREPEPTSVGGVLIWIPRLVLWPVHRVLDVGVRQLPVRLVSLAEQYHLYPWLRWLFIWRDGQVGLLPTFMYEFGLRPSVGLYYFHNNLLWRRNHLTMHGGYWGSDWAGLYLKDQWLPPGDRTRLALAARLLRRPDQPYFGTGPQTYEVDESYYQRNSLGVWAEFTRDFGGLNRARLSAGYHRSTFTDGDSPAISTKFDPASIPGFGGYSLTGAALQVRLDTRQARVLAPETGLRLELNATYAIDPGTPQRHFLRWSGEAAGTLDLTGRRHSLELKVFTGFVEKLGSEPVPFTELESLGGYDRLRGYMRGRFRGDSAIEITADYRYPIWAYVDAELFTSLGNVYAGHLDDIAPQRMFLCWGLALRSAITRDIYFDLLFGFGTNRLDSGSIEVNSFNVAFGVHPAFGWNPAFGVYQGF